LNGARGLWLLLDCFVIPLGLAAGLSSDSPTTPAAPPSYYLEYTAREAESLERFTLFKDGMAVYKARRPGVPELLLKQQLSSEELKVYLDAIGASGVFDLHEKVRPTMTGQLVQNWTLALSLPKRGERSFEGTAIQSVPLPVGKMLRIAQDLAEALLQKWRDTDPFQERVPVPGDVLESFENNLYAVVRFVAERDQYELRGVKQPLTSFIKTGELKLFFKGYADLPGKP